MPFRVFQVPVRNSTPFEDQLAKRGQAGFRSVPFFQKSKDLLLPVSISPITFSHGLITGSPANLELPLMSGIWTTWWFGPLALPLEPACGFRSNAGWPTNCGSLSSRPGRSTVPRTA